MNLNTRVSWGLLVALLMVVVFRVPYVTRPFHPSGRDTAATVYSVSRMLEGQLLYRDTADNKPPLTHFIVATVFRCFGKTMTAVNAIGIVASMTATVFVFLLTNRLFGRTAAAGAALFYAVFSNSDTVYGSDVSYGFWMLPFMAAAVYCFVQGLQPDERRKGLWMLACGACSGLAVTCKQHALFNFLALLSYLALVAWKDRTQRAQLPRQLFMLSLGYALAWLPFLLYFWSKGGLADFLSSLSPAKNLNYIRHLQKQVGPDVKRLTLGQNEFIRQISNDTILWIFAAAGSAHLFISREKNTEPESSASSPLKKDKVAQPSWLRLHIWRGKSQAGSLRYITKPVFQRAVNAPLLLWLWALWSLVGVCIAGYFHAHYFLQLMPVFSVLAGYVCGECFQETNWRASLRQMPAVLLIAAMVIGFWLPTRAHISELQWEVEYVLAGKHRARTDMEKVGRYLRDNTSPNDTIFIWCWNSELYYLADRKAPSKWWESGIYRGRWPLMAPEFEKNKPKFIVKSPYPLMVGTFPPPEFEEFVQRNYVPDAKFGWYDILRLRQP